MEVRPLEKLRPAGCRHWGKMSQLRGRGGLPPAQEGMQKPPAQHCRSHAWWATSTHNWGQAHASRWSLTPGREEPRQGGCSGGWRAPGTRASGNSAHSPQGRGLREPAPRLGSSAPALGAAPPPRSSTLASGSRTPPRAAPRLWEPRPRWGRVLACEASSATPAGPLGWGQLLSSPSCSLSALGLSACSLISPG